MNLLFFQRKKMIVYFLRFHYNIIKYIMWPVLTPPPIRGPVIAPVIAQRRNAIGQVERFNFQGDNVGVNLMDAFDAVMANHQQFDAVMATRPMVDPRMGG
jgi:hypothetical protein